MKNVLKIILLATIAVACTNPVGLSPKQMSAPTGAPILPGLPAYGP